MIDNKYVKSNKKDKINSKTSHYVKAVRYVLHSF